MDSNKDAVTTVNNSLMLYTLVNLETGQFEKHAPLWEIQSWTRLLQGDKGWMNPKYKRLDLLNLEQLKVLYFNTTGAAPPSGDHDKLMEACFELAQQLPVDDTSIEQLRQMLQEKGIGHITKQEGETMSEATTASPAGTAKEKAPRAKGAKTLVREYFATADAAATLEELSKATGKPTSSITTAISDLRSEKYCKPGEPLKLHRWSTDSKYRLAEEPAKPAEAAPPEGQTAEAPADALPAA